MPCSARPLGRTAADETSSPELVLVDPGLAIRARERLEQPDDTLARLEREIRLHRLASLDAAADFYDLTRDRASRWRSASARSARMGYQGLRTRFAAVTVLAAALLTALFLGVNVDLRGAPAGAGPDDLNSPTTIGSPSRYKAARAGTALRERLPSRRPSGRPTATRQIGARRFAWAPVPDASGYHVEFFHGAARIYSRETSYPQMALPETWSFDGRTHRLSPGRYRWYVWPVTSGSRAFQAIVQSELVISKS